MFENFCSYLNDKAKFTNAEIEQIKAVSQVKKISKGELLMQEGTLWIYNAFVCSGLLRSFYTDVNGTEFTLSFAPENYWAGDRQSILSGKPTPYSVDAIEDTVVILIEQKDFYELSKKIDAFNTMMSTLIQKHLVVTEDNVNNSIRLSAAQKYYTFLAKYGRAAQRIPAHMIASYIGTTLQGLEQIKKNRL
ncbi:cyclic nucleotide-binding domain-containing protein [Flavobacterium sp. Sd200]|uniref:Crp/Fnr family transcriptional regulator n=1 Tax=Flavobacterium sp. Sd200 TaxID=2692211 RepID=UPI00136CD0CE|nr:Crp/Fnr family transcriptional regulator [Flavobacterium sp. Sd200]MXN93050.1 cyclic nucleotide-binding domain-containing protein [Flavobacterium sp. Sd200]